MAAKKPAAEALPHAFDVQEFLDSAGLSRRIVRFARGARAFAQGSPATSVFYIQSGQVKLSVVSRSGKEAVVAILGPGDFFGEGCLAGQPRRMGTATAMQPTMVLRIAKDEMMRTLHEQSALSDRFIAHMLARNIRIEEDLVDQLFNSSEKRLARTLLLLARYGEDAAPLRVLPKLSQEMLAEMVGTTRSRILAAQGIPRVNADAHDVWRASIGSQVPALDPPAAVTRGVADHQSRCIRG